MFLTFTTHQNVTHRINQDKIVLISIDHDLGKVVIETDNRKSVTIMPTAEAIDVKDTLGVSLSQYDSLLANISLIR
jgi:hypothetical protein